MDIIFGGVFQGKLAYALQTYELTMDQVHMCKGTTIDKSKQLFNNCHELVFALVAQNIDPLAYFQEHIHVFEHKVLIFDDISCGVVPMDATLRKAREENGRVMGYLCGHAQQVVRVFCQIPTRIK